MKLLIIGIFLISGSLLAQSKNDTESNKMTCEHVYGDTSIVGKKPYLIRCENKKEVCISQPNGIACYPKPKE
jgi:hypothetical protein